MHNQYPDILLVRKSKTLKLANAPGLALALLGVSSVFNLNLLHLNLRLRLRGRLGNHGLYTDAK